MTLPAPPSPYRIDTLLQILVDLRNPDFGCPWDREQDFASIAPYTIEEAYEVADAIARGDLDDLKSELGDLLLQVVYHARIAQERRAFDFADVVSAVCDKMIRRHPHVYGSADGEEVPRGGWEAIKAEERGRAGAESALAGVALGLPSLKRAEKLQRRAARVGFDWPDADGPRAKIDEELAEVDSATSSTERAAEVGDLLFSVVNYARHLDIDPEAALRDANARFETRFRHVEKSSARPLTDLTLAELEQLWQGAKAAQT